MMNEIKGEKMDMKRLTFDDLRRILGNNFTKIFNISEGDIINIGPFLEQEDPDEYTRRKHRCGSLADLASVYAENYHIYCAVGVCFLGTVSNSLNVAVLTRKEMAAIPINRILTALAVADIMLMVEYVSFHTYYHLDVSGRRDFPYMGAVFALFHIHFSQVLHTTSICLTLALAKWRYLALKYPERGHILGSDKRCSLAITLSFIIPIILCSPTFLSFHIESTVIEEDKNYTLYTAALVEELRENELLLKANFWIYGVFIKLLPCCILSVISCWLVKTLITAKNRKRILRGYGTDPVRAEGKTKAEIRADRTTRMLIAILLLFLLTEFPQGLFALYIALKGEYFFLVCYQKYGAVMDILALNNGSVNFILYCYMNRMFRVTFGQLFKKRLLSKLKDNTNSEVQSTLV